MLYTICYNYIFLKLKNYNVECKKGVGCRLLAYMGGKITEGGFREKLWLFYVIKGFNVWTKKDYKHLRVAKCTNRGWVMSLRYCKGGFSDNWKWIITIYVWKSNKLS